MLSLVKHHRSERANANKEVMQFMCIFSLSQCGYLFAIVSSSLLSQVKLVRYISAKQSSKQKASQCPNFFE